MSLTESVIEGTLKPDGTLELDQKPSLSPGRVQVTVRLLGPSATGRRGLVEVMDEIRQGQRRGYVGRTPQEMLAAEKTRQEEEEDYERRCEQLWGGPLPPTKS